MFNEQLIVQCLLILLHVKLSGAVPYQAELFHLDRQWYPVLARQVTSTSISASPNPTKTPDSSCVHSAFTRQCWGDGFSIATNYDAVWPVTGRVVEYFLEIQNRTLAPDGTSRPVYAINGQFPGPTIRANWGDTLKITVKNGLNSNGTSIHWHGLRQYKSFSSDGTGGVTECPIAPGQQRTYTFLCTQFGTSWYHSHYSHQYADGVQGSIIIDGPATSNYDVDLGAYPITDWFYTPAFTIAPLVEHAVIRGPPPGDNVLINGTNIDGSGRGAYSQTMVTKGKKYRLRLINTSMQDTFQVGLDGHLLTVITADFVPIVPYTAQWITIGIGQRYDVIINANQGVDNYWFHAIPQSGCANNKNNNALAIFSYIGAASAIPSNSTISNRPANTICVDDNSKFVPYVKLDVPSNYTIPDSSRLDVGFAITQDAANQTLVQWNLNQTAMVAQWDYPTIQYVLDHQTTYPQQANIITLPYANRWSYWVIQAVPTLAPAQAHPMHLHGHDFYVLGAGSGTYSNSAALNYKNPPRRDTAMLPANGWLVLAFITDNPGPWLMHCHIAFHVSLGLGAQFLERADDIPEILGGDVVAHDSQCTAWKRYYATALYKQSDSGL